MYTVPDFQNPTGTTWSAAKRQHLVDLARTHDFRIVEDSPTAFFATRARRYRRSPNSDAT
ncbi:MAG: hypothetical protein EOQ42_19335 [Mesorhizobium sp.]|nr:MAG: hypothetical protein EOQ42_19335 [Mesorhizobium sp.]TIT16566.1 MAG: hypothetical protein E5W85_02485 [Mesorhizobium sp.]